MDAHASNSSTAREAVTAVTAKKSYAPLVLLVAFVLVLCGWWFSQLLDSTDYSDNQFQIIPAEEFTIDDLNGYVTYLDFWAAWCIPCRESFPWMQEMRERFADTKLRIVAVNLDQTTESMQEFLNEHQTDFSIVTDSSYSLFRQYGIQGVPTSLLFNEQGEEIWRHSGFQQKHIGDYQQAIEQSLGLLNTSKE